MGESPLVDELILKLRRKVLSEIEFQKQLFQLSGILDLVLSANVSNREIATKENNRQVDMNVNFKALESENNELNRDEQIEEIS
jgi:hypothetical protein